MKCEKMNANGEPCDAPEALVRDGVCLAHRPGGQEHLESIASLGGQALARKLAGSAFEAADLAPLVTLEDAKLALDEIRVAVLTRRVTHTEGASAAKAVSEWVKTEGAATTSRLVNELRVELDARLEEIAELRKQLANKSRLRVAS